APMRKDYPYREPSELDAIRAERPKDRPSLKKPSRYVLRDKIAGAWRGRICGCLLGKPVEGMTQEEILRIARDEGNYPIRDYFGKDPDALRAAGHSDKTLERLAYCYRRGFMPPDDDTNYTVLDAVKVIDVFGRDFTPDDMARVWLSSQPVTAYCTAERVAVMNFVTSVKPPLSAVYKNPFREWIGAQIRGDYFGYINPADPEAAADMAFRDASISHVKNGIYGEMLFSAAIAAAAAESDPEKILRAGLGEIPARSRLAEDVETVISWFRSGVPAEEAFARIRARWDEKNPHHWCHTNSNAMIVAAALLYGGMDYGKSIAMAVEAGFDTDCNGATVGSIVGMAMGKDAVGEIWTSAVNDTVDTTIIGYGMFKIEELVDLTMKHLA
ncbi:MAG: ADP-ribosylglycohydrolase family protein, partial [Clostridia bacterium]|nr:ADP-ribosylglycohydrolase family protein [Clostridia bacterium]